MADYAHLLPAGLPTDPALLPTLLELLPMGVIYYTPVLDEAGTLTDLALSYLSPAARRMTGLPAQPETTYRRQFPTTDDNGAWDFHRRSWASAGPREFQFYYDADGFDSYFRVVAQRLGEGLLVVFTDTRDEVRGEVEKALRDSQARERAALARAEAAQREAEVAHADLANVFTQAPAMICIFEGPAHVFQFVNPPYQALVGERPLLGKPIAEAMPELAGQPIFGLLDQVYQTGETFAASEMLVQLDHHNEGRPELEKRYYNFIYKARYDRQGVIDGILVFAYEVTTQVLARQQVEQLNQELEARVQVRAREALALQAELLATAQRQVQARESFYQVFEQTPAAVSLLRGPTHRFDYVNPVFQQVFAGRQLLGRNFAEALPDAAAQGFLGLLDGVYRTGETFFGDEVPFVAESPGGPAYTTYFNFTYQAYRENGEIVGISTFALDVTEQVRSRQVRETLREAQRRELAVLFEQAPAGVCILDGPELVYSFANPAYQQILPGRELLGRSVLDVLPELRGTEVEALLRQVYATGQTYRAQEQCIPVAGADGALENRYFTLVYQARLDESSRITGILNLVVEATGQVLARQQADEAAAELRLLTAHSPAFLFRTDAAGRLLYLNRSFFEWTGLDAARLPSLDEGWTVVHPGDLAVQQPSFVAAIAAGEPWQSTPYRFRRHDGQYRWMLSRSQPLFGPAGQVLGHTGLTVEIHEQMELQQQLERTNVDLDNFIYTASHDLKAPITNIEGLLLALEHELPAADRPGDVTLMLTMMQGAVERFRRTINHLTDLSRLQKEHNPAADAVALAPVVEDVRLDLLPLLATTHGALTVSIPAELTVTFAEKNLRSVVYNLLSNAFKYHHPDREPLVHLRGSLTDEHVVLEVQDNGLGLDLTQGQERLFGMFQRLHTHVEGTGVGLYMVRRILENAGGRIEVSSALGEGTTFRVFFRR